MESPKSAGRPWTRFWARIFDNYVFGLCTVIVVLSIAPETLQARGATQVLSLLSLFLWAYVESVLLAFIGTTPGKWLLSVELRQVSGARLSFSSALFRSLMVWWRGLGAGILIVSLFTLYMAYGRLTKTGTTTWDKEEQCQLVYHRIRPLRVITLGGAIAVIYALAIVGYVIDA